MTSRRFTYIESKGRTFASNTGLRFGQTNYESDQTRMQCGIANILVHNELAERYKANAEFIETKQ